MSYANQGTALTDRWPPWHETERSRRWTTRLLNESSPPRCIEGNIQVMPGSCRPCCVYPSRIRRRGRERSLCSPSSQASGGQGHTDGRLAGRTQKIARAVNWIRWHFAEGMRVEELAETTHMSPTTFRQHFRSITSMSSVQF